MNADKLLDAFSELEEGAVRSAGALLGFEEERMRTRRPVKIIIRAVLIAAILATLSIGAAYAMGLFTMDIRSPELIAAILATLSIGAAYAMGLFTMEVRTPEEGEELTGHYTYYDPAQQKDVTEETDLSNATLVLQLDGAGENHKVRFRPGWLPEEQEGYTLERISSTTTPASLTAVKAAAACCIRSSATTPAPAPSFIWTVNPPRW